MSKNILILNNKTITREVDFLLDSGFTPNAIKTYLLQQYNFSISTATIYNYKNNHYKPKPYRKILKDKIFKDCGRFIDIVESKVAIIFIFMDRISKALENEERTPFILKSVDESLMKLNTILSELFSIYKDLGLIQERKEHILINAEINTSEKNENKLEPLIADLTKMERSNLMNEIGKKIIETVNIKK